MPLTAELTSLTLRRTDGVDRNISKRLVLRVQHIYGVFPNVVFVCGWTFAVRFCTECLYLSHGLFFVGFFR